MANKIVNGLEKVSQFFNEVKLEMKKVTWSTKAELKSSTIIVLTAIGIFVVIIGSFDFAVSRILQSLIYR